MKLSIVIPAFNECGKIGYDVESACEFLQRNGFEGEIIVADDGSRDTTADEAEKAGENMPQWSRGKSNPKPAAPRQGIRRPQRNKADNRRLRDVRGQRQLCPVG